MANDRFPVGLVLGSVMPPEDIPIVAKRGEELGFGELWLAEDYFFTGGISARRPSSGDERMYRSASGSSRRWSGTRPCSRWSSRQWRGCTRRLLPGIGLGVPAWLGQMGGLTPPSQLAAMRECVSSVRRLLDGEELTEEGRSFAFQT